MARIIAPTSSYNGWLLLFTLLILPFILIFLLLRAFYRHLLRPFFRGLRFWLVPTLRVLVARANARLN